MSNAHVSWNFPTTRGGLPFSPGTKLQAAIYDTTSPTPATPVATWTGGVFGGADPGAPASVDIPETPGTAHSFYVIVNDGTLQSAPSATVSGTTPNVQPDPATNVAVNFT